MTAPAVAVWQRKPGGRLVIVHIRRVNPDGTVDITDPRNGAWRTVNTSTLRPCKGASKK